MYKQLAFVKLDPVFLQVATLGWPLKTTRRKCHTVDYVQYVTLSLCHLNASQPSPKLDNNE